MCRSCQHQSVVIQISATLFVNVYRMHNAIYAMVKTTLNLTFVTVEALYHALCMNTYMHTYNNMQT